jgi:DNA repair ATPase RecN
MIKLELKNFQSFTHESFSFREGITVITGPNSSGKTAIFRAIEALITNPVGAKDYIKYNTKKAEVHLTLSDINQEFSWSRTEKGVVYQANGQKYSKVGRDNVYKVYPEFPLLQDNRGGLLNMHTEWDIMFPFDRSDGELFKLFEDIFQIADSSTIIKGFASDQKEFKAEDLRLKHKEARILEKKEAIDALSVTVSIDVVREFERKIADATKNHAEVAQAVNQLRKATKLLINTKDIQKKEFNLEIIPKMIELEADICKILELSKVLGVNIHKQDFDLEILKERAELNRSVGIALEKKHELRLADELLIGFQEKKAEIQEKLDSFTTCPLCQQRIK